jgi:hypothetical protein
MNSYPSLESAWEAFDLRVAWRDGTVIATIPRGGILDAMHPDAEAERLAEQAEEARREEIRNLATNVILLEDWRK